MSSRVAATLHDEHLATGSFIDRLEAMIAPAGGGRVYATDPAIAKLLLESTNMLGPELERHFDFEEHPLFERLAEDGEDDVVAQLLAEHRAIRPIAARLVCIGADARAEGFTEASWSEYRALAGELCALLHAHVEIEERMLLPLIEEMLDADADALLHAGYAGNV